MKITIPRLIALLALTLTGPARAWSPDEVSTEPGVPNAVAQAWAAASPEQSGKDWDKYYFEDEAGQERTIWCRHKDCDAAAKSGDPSRRAPLYYLAAAGASGWRAVLAAYDLHWEPSRNAGLVAAISRPGSSLGVRPARPWKKDDPWSLPAGSLVEAPATHEVPPPASLLAEARDWPSCLSLDPASYGAEGRIRGLLPMEIELNEAGPLGQEDGALGGALGNLARAGDAPAAQRLRARAMAAAEEAARAQPPRDRFTPFEARFLYCRVKRYDRFGSFRAEMGRSKDPSGFVARWRHFVQGELAVYRKEASGRSRGYQPSLAGLEQRTVTALGALPYLAGEYGRPHTKELAEASSRVEAVLEELR